MRGPVPPGQEGGPRGHRPAGALRGRLVPGPEWHSSGGLHGGANLPAAIRSGKRGGDRRRPGGPHLRRRPGQAGAQGDDLRGAAPPRWGAELRHPRVPPPQGCRAGRGGVRRVPGSRAQVRHGGGEGLHRGRAAGRVGLRRGVPGHRCRAAHLHGHSGREQQRGLLRQRVSHAQQPDEGIPLPPSTTPR